MTISQRSPLLRMSNRHEKYDKSGNEEDLECLCGTCGCENSDICEEDGCLCCSYDCYGVVPKLRVRLNV